MQFPLTLTFKVLALAPQITVTDRMGQNLYYVKQKLLKLREAITVYRDNSQTEELFKINADRIIDFSAKYHISDARTGQAIGAIKRDGVRSLLRARYDVVRGDRIIYDIEEESAMVRLMDSLFGEIPIIGMLSGYVFNPVYLMKDASGQVVMTITKEKAFLETGFKIDQKAQMSEEDTQLAVLGAFMMVLLERIRG